jgi:glycerol-3-phosphate responsive antiterminator
MPSRLRDIIEFLSKTVEVPVITGGLLTEDIHAKEVLDCGAAAVTTSAKRHLEGQFDRKYTILN